MVITITLKKSEIDYDIAMTTHVVMNRELAAGATEEQGFNYANTQDESGEVHLMNRYVENAIHELTAGVSRYILDYSIESNNDLKEFESGIFSLNMPDTFDSTITGALRSAMHDYVVNRSIYDWYMKTKPDEAVIYDKLYNDAYEKVKSFLNRRKGFTKIKPWPAI